MIVLKKKDLAHPGKGMLFTQPVYRSLLLSRFAVIPAMVARIGSVGSDPDTGSLAHVAYRTILFHMSGLLLLIHGN
jgi:hypothetical protein